MENNNKSYVVIQDDTLSCFSMSVIRLIEDGWLPQGGVSVYEDKFTGSSRLMYVQAMTKNVFKLKDS